jgi:hypothetical protein
MYFIFFATNKNGEKEVINGRGGGLLVGCCHWLKVG